MLTSRTFQRGADDFEYQVTALWAAERQLQARSATDQAQDVRRIAPAFTAIAAGMAPRG